MPDDFSLKRSARLNAAYADYRAALDGSGVAKRFMPYRWWTLPNPISGLWLVYSSMLEDYSTDLANVINDLTHHVARLRAWAIVVEPMDDDAKMEVAHEFIGILGVAALSAPYAIKSRFAVAAAHLSHQANMAKDLENWKDEFPDKNLYLNDLEPFGRTWGKFRRFKLKVEPIAGSGFKAQTHDFRNAYNHRFSPRLLLGLSNTVTRYVDGATGVVSYGVGGTPPLDLNKVADVLQLECDHCYVAFEAFQALIGEQVEAITKFETKNASKTKAV